MIRRDISIHLLLAAAVVVGFAGCARVKLSAPSTAAATTTPSALDAPGMQKPSVGAETFVATFERANPAQKVAMFTHLGDLGAGAARVLPTIFAWLRSPDAVSQISVQDVAVIGTLGPVVDPFLYELINVGSAADLRFAAVIAQKRRYESGEVFSSLMQSLDRLTEEENDTRLFVISTLADIPKVHRPSVDSRSPTVRAMQDLLAGEDLNRALQAAGCLGLLRQHPEHVLDRLHVISRAAAEYPGVILSAYPIIEWYGDVALPTLRRLSQSAELSERVFAITLLRSPGLEPAIVELAMLSAFADRAAEVRKLAVAGLELRQRNMLYVNNDAVVNAVDSLLQHEHDEGVIREALKLRTALNLRTDPRAPINKD